MIFEQHSGLPQRSMSAETVEDRILLLRWIRSKLVTEQQSWQQVSKRLKAAVKESWTVESILRQIRASEEGVEPAVKVAGSASVVVKALQDLGQPASISELAIKIYGVSSVQTRNRVSVHLSEQKKHGTVLRGQGKGAPWRLFGK